MKSVLVCPAHRPALASFSSRRPLVLLPLLGRPVIDHWLHHLAGLGASHVTLVVADRVPEVSRHVGDGARWGLEIEVVAQAREMSRDETFRQFREDEPGTWLGAPYDLVVMDHLPALPARRLFESSADWFATARDLIPQAATPDRVGLREWQPGVWVGLHAHIAPSAQLHAPCWIGDDCYVGPGSQIGPDAVLEDRAFVEAGARISQSIVGPDTFVGGITDVRQSLVWGAQLINHRTGSALRVVDDFLLCSLESKPLGFTPVAWWRRRAEAFARVLASPAAALLRREPLAPASTPRPAGSRSHS